jgi:hypothetical protein
MYDSRFEPTAEEFGYKMVRHNSHEELAPIANAKLRPGGGSIKLSERN